jgi:hypothetical protein
VQRPTLEILTVAACSESSRLEGGGDEKRECVATSGSLLRARLNGNTSSDRPVYVENVPVASASENKGGQSAKPDLEIRTIAERSQCPRPVDRLNLNFETGSNDALFCKTLRDLPEERGGYIRLVVEIRIPEHAGTLHYSR